MKNTEKDKPLRAMALNTARAAVTAAIELIENFNRDMSAITCKACAFCGKCNNCKLRHFLDEKLEELNTTADSTDRRLAAHKSR